MIPETPVYGAQRRNISPPSEWIVGYPEVGQVSDNGYETAIYRPKPKYDVRVGESRIVTGHTLISSFRSLCLTRGDSTRVRAVRTL